MLSLLGIQDEGNGPLSPLQYQSVNPLQMGQLRENPE